MHPSGFLEEEIDEIVAGFQLQDSALLKTTSSAAALKVGSWIRALRLP